MGHKKLIRFEEIKTFPNVLIFPKDIKGEWATKHFRNNLPLTLELACGKGEYTVGMARRFKNKNFVGVDIKGNRIWKGAKIALEDEVSNAAFLRIQIDHIADYFAENEVADIWITFPDPFLRKSKAKKRLTHLRFLHHYKKILQPEGRIHLKTDSPELYEFTQEVIAENNCILHKNLSDVYANEPNELLKIKTFYEKMHLEDGRTIRYLEFSLPEVLPEWPKKLKKDESREEQGQ